MSGAITQMSKSRYTILLLLLVFSGSGSMQLSHVRNTQILYRESSIGTFDHHNPNVYQVKIIPLQVKDNHQFDAIRVLWGTRGVVSIVISMPSLVAVTRFGFGQNMTNMQSKWRDLSEHVSITSCSTILWYLWRIWMMARSTKLSESYFPISLPVCEKSRLCTDKLHCKVTDISWELQQP